MILTVTLNACIDKRYVVSTLQQGEVNRVKKCVYSSGGKGINVARVVAIMGKEAMATGFVGGHAGAYILDHMKPYGIKDAFYQLEGESRSCINIWNEETKTQTELLEPGFTVRPGEYSHFKERYKELLPQIDVVALSGSIPKGMGADAYIPLIEIAKECGKKVILDTSGEMLVQGIKAKPDLIKPNIDEIRMLTGKKCDTEEELVDAAMDLQRQGIPIVVISLGADGAIVVCEEGIYRAQVPVIEAVNTVGCGDSMIGGFVLGLAEHRKIEEILRLASAMSAAAALREETAFFLKEDMERIYQDIVINKI